MRTMLDLAYISPGTDGSWAGPWEALTTALFFWLFTWGVVSIGSVEGEERRRRCGFLLGAGLAGAVFFVLLPSELRAQAARVGLLAALVLGPGFGLGHVVARSLIALGHFLHGCDLAGPVYRRLAVPGRR